MTTKSSARSIKSRFSSSNSTYSMATNDSDTKSSRIHIKKPFSTTNFLQSSSSTNGFSNQIKKRTLQLNNFFHSKRKSNHVNESNNTNQSDEPARSSPIVFHAIAPVSPEEIKQLPQYVNYEQKVNNELKSSSLDNRIRNVFAHTKIKAMSSDEPSSIVQSNYSDDEENQLKFHPVLSSMDADADESDNGSNNSIKRAHRLQKTRQTSISSLQQKFENNNCKDEQQLSSSDEHFDKELNSIVNGHHERRIKSSSLLLAKRFDLLTTATATATTTTDDDSKEQSYAFHPLDNLESNQSTINDSSISSIPITNASTKNQTSAKKVNRFQVKSIHKSQQPQMILAKMAAAKSSNDDDYSLTNENSNLSVKPLIMERKHSNTPTTDIENSTTNTNHIVNGVISTLISVQNEENHVHFCATLQDKHDSAVDEDKSPSVTATVTVLPTSPPPPHSSTHSVQAEYDEEEEAVAKSPDNRFIKYAKEIGRGAFKTVYRGLDTETSVAVAWCELQDFAQFDKHERARFKEEAEMLKKLQHPNIVRFYDFWEETNPRTNKKVIILVTELMTSGSLKGYIRNFKGQKEEKRINVMKKWCRQILKGLGYLHSRNPPVIHRDLKCDNVFISSTTGCVKIGDLGLATFKTQTFAKSMRGTMEFMAPEMFDEQYDELVDIYSFGLCMLEMMTGEYPYIECKGPTAVIKRVTAGLKPDCYYKVESEDVREVIDCCIRTNREERLPVQELLQHSFFLDDNGLRIDLTRDPANDHQVMVTNDSVNLKLKIVDKTKRKALWTEHEAILFRYNFTTDTPEQIADELLEKNYIFEEDKKFVAQSIKDRVRSYRYEQIDRKAGVFCRDGKPYISQTSQTSLSIQQSQPAPAPAPQQQVTSPPPQQALHHQPLPPQQQLTPPLQPQLIPPQQQPQQQQVPQILTPTAPLSIPPQSPQASPLLVQPQIGLAASLTSATSMVQQPPTLEVIQQQITKTSSENVQSKPMVATEPIPIPQITEANSNASGSAGSLDLLDAALKKTFNKSSTSQGTSNVSTITNEITEPTVPLVSQDDPSITKLGNEPIVIEQQQQQQQQIDEPTGVTLPIELTKPMFQLPTPSTLQTQSQPTTMLASTSQQILQNPLLLTQASQSFSYSTIPPPQHIINTIITNDILKQPIPSSSTATTATATTETVENSLLSMSPPPPSSLSNEPIQTSNPSDASSSTQPPILGTLQQLDALLKDTFKNSSKTAGTTHNSDTEMANTNVPSVSLPINDEISTRSIEMESDLINTSDEKQVISNAVILPSCMQPESILIPKLVQQAQLQPTRFEPLIPSEKNISELDSSIKISHARSISNDDNIIAVSSTDLSDLKSMIVDLSKTLINRMTIIENKIDEQNAQTLQINHLLTKTILPSFIDITNIIHETPNLDPRIQTKLENIEKNIRLAQQQKPIDMKDLMEI